METADWVATIIAIAGVIAGGLGSLPAAAARVKIALWIACIALVIVAIIIAVAKDWVCCTDR